MAILTRKYWIEITPGVQKSLDDGDGKWVVFLRRDYYGSLRESEQQLVRHIQEIVDDHSLRGALITKNQLDVGIFFTSADRRDIWQVRQILKRELKLKDKDMMWKANFETEFDWETSRGNLWFLAKIYDAFLRKEHSLQQGEIAKAERIQRKDVDRLITAFRKTLLKESIMNRRSMVVTPAFPSVDYEIDPKLVFVLMPFTEEWSDEAYYLIKRVGKAAGLEVARTDDIFEPSIIVNDIWEMINKAGLIIADITVHNANVFYELGLAHAIGKKVVLIRQEGGERAPFDVAFWRYFEYGLDSVFKTEEFEKTLTKVLCNYRFR